METPQLKLKPVPFTHVQFADSFFAPRIETNRAVTAQSDLRVEQKR